MSDETLKRIDVMLSKNEIDFYITWVIEIEERIKRLCNKCWIAKKTKLHYNAVKTIEKNQVKC